ncbi:MAG: hypothetical protein AAF674_09025 [Pseudomonadota bacterium]
MTKTTEPKTADQAPAHADLTDAELDGVSAAAGTTKKALVDVIVGVNTQAGRGGTQRG